MTSFVWISRKILLFQEMEKKQLAVEFFKNSIWCSRHIVSLKENVLNNYHELNLVQILDQI